MLPFFIPATSARRAARGSGDFRHNARRSHGAEIRLLPSDAVRGLCGRFAHLAGAEPPDGSPPRAATLRRRLVAGLIRGAPHEYLAYNVDPSESWERQREGVALIMRAWTE